MDAMLQQRFTERWQRYFGETELPIGFYYTDQVTAADLAASRPERGCLVGSLSRVRQGYPFVYAADTAGCPGGKRYAGFTDKLRPKFEYFLSCGIPGELEGERYKKTPALVWEHLRRHPPLPAPGRYLVCKRWDRFAAAEEPLAVVFFATPDVRSGLFALANFDAPGSDAVVAPMGSGCASIIEYPREQALREYLVPFSREEWHGKALFRQVGIDRRDPVLDFGGARTTHQALADRYGVFLSPTVLVVDANGRPLGEPIVGLLTVDFYGAYIDNALKAARAKLAR